jgi:hypothetical protein
MADLMYHAELHNTVVAPWTDMNPIHVGDVPAGAGTPGVYVTVERNGRPLARIDVWPLAAGPFSHVVAWRKFVVVGWGDQVHLVEPLSRQVSSIACDGYIGHLYPVGAQLLIADATRLISVDARGERLWTSDRLGIDGVVVDAVHGGIITGQGEWDPPGGWRPFRVSLESGELTT